MGSRSIGGTQASGRRMPRLLLVALLIAGTASSPGGYGSREGYERNKDSEKNYYKDQATSYGNEREKGDTIEGKSTYRGRANRYEKKGEEHGNEDYKKDEYSYPSSAYSKKEEYKKKGYGGNISSYVQKEEDHKGYVRHGYSDKEEHNEYTSDGYDQRDKKHVGYGYHKSDYEKVKYGESEKNDHAGSSSDYVKEEDSKGYVKVSASNYDDKKEGNK